MSGVVHYVVARLHAECGVSLDWNPWGVDALPASTREADRVTCPRCLEAMADQVEGAIGCNHVPWEFPDSTMTCTKCGKVVVVGDES